MKLSSILFSPLLEALKPSQYRGLVRGWDKNKYEDLFRKYTDDKKAYRIYLPIHGEQKDVHVPDVIKDAVESAGYEIEDYVLGIASKDDGKRKIKIGKLLKDTTTQQKFANDPQRAAGKRADYYVVISRHPYDIAGMSTNRGWTSCMNLENGSNKKYVPLDVKEGTLVAYVVKEDDKNINNPVGRILIKPYYNLSKKGEVAFGVESKVYGTDVSGFRHAVMKWVDEVNDQHELNGLFELPSTLYNDGSERSKLIGKNIPDLEKVMHDPSYIKNIKNPSIELQRAAVSKSYLNLRFIDDPDLDLVKELATKNADILQYAKVSDECILELFKKNPQIIKYIKNPTEEQQKSAIDRFTHPYYWTYIKNPSESVMMYALKKDPSYIAQFRGSQTEKMHEYVLNHHLEMMKGAVKGEKDLWDSFSWLRSLENPSKTIIEKIYKISPKTILYLDFSTDNKVKIPKNIVEDVVTRYGKEALSRLPIRLVSKDLQKKVAEKDITAISFVSADVKKEVIEKRPEAIQYIVTGNNMTGKMSNIGKELCMIALAKDPNVLKFIDMPTPEMVNLAVKHNYKLILDVKTKYMTVEAMTDALLADASLRGEILARLKKSRMSKKLELVDKAIASRKNK